MTNATRVIGQFRWHARAKLLGNARCGPLLHAPTVTACKHGTQVRSVEIEKRNERHFLAIELIGKIRRWVERCQHVIHAGALIANKVVPASQRSAHFIEVPADLPEGLLQTRKQACAQRNIGNEVLLAQRAECSSVAIGRGPAISSALDASGRVVTSSLAMSGNNRRDGCLAVTLGNHVRERGGRRWR